MLRRHPPPPTPTSLTRGGGGYNNSGNSTPSNNDFLLLRRCRRYFYNYFWWILFGFIVFSNITLLSKNIDIVFSKTTTTTITLPQQQQLLFVPQPPANRRQRQPSSTTTTSTTNSNTVRRKKFVESQSLIQPKITTVVENMAIENENVDNIIESQQPPPAFSNNQQRHHQQQTNQQQRKRPNNNNNEYDGERYDHTFSFCLLIKDDNSILMEWLAYHYHTLNLRYLIVGVDPSSSTSPLDIIQKFTSVIGHDLKYEIWNDPDYMPEFFIQGHYEKVPRMIKYEDKNLSKWQEEEGEVEEGGVLLSEEDKIHKDYMQINNHRYRQSKFLQHCSKHIQNQNKTWLSHIDTDEYIVLNPLIRQQLPRSITTKSNIQITNLHVTLQKNSLWQLLELLYDKDPITINWPCLSMPRILYGSIVDDFDNSHETKSILETLRWKYHTSYTNDTLNKQPKVIMDVSGFPQFNLTRKAFSIHRPSLRLCRPRNKIQVRDYNQYPLVVNHYVGSYERYKSRQNDPRRTKKLYQSKALVKDGGKDNDNNWIDNWFTTFIQEYGHDKVTKLFPNMTTTTVSSHSISNTAIDDGGSAVTRTTETANYIDNATIEDDEILVRPPKLGQKLSLKDDDFSACLLIKDDNDILNEWIAYHYHVMKLRTILVATDPSSITSPSIVLNRWKHLMKIIEWTDTDYMPEFFLNKHYDQVPNLIGNMTNSTNSIYHNTNNNTSHHQLVDKATVQKELQEVNNHRFRQSTFFYNCITHLRTLNKTWMMHIDTDEYIVMHPIVRKQDHWRKLKYPNFGIGPSSILQFLKVASKQYSDGMSYPCISMPRLLFGSKEDHHSQADDDTDTKVLVNPPPPFDDKKKFETLRWKYHSHFDNDIERNGKPKVILDLSGLPPKSRLLDPENGVFSIHRPGLRMCRSFRDVFFNVTHKFPITVNHYIGSWERYSSRNDVRRNSEAYQLKASVGAGKDDNWIDGWVESFVKEMGLEQVKQLLAEYTTVGGGGGGESINGNGLQLELDEELSKEDRKQNDSSNDNTPRNDGKRMPDALKNFDASKRMEFSACLLTKDDNDILDEWIAYHYQVLGLRYMIVAVDAKSVTSPTPLLDKWRKFGMTIEEWKDEMFMPDLYFQKAYHLQPRLVKIKKNKHKWLDGIDDPEMKEKYVHEIQDHRYRQIVFVSECTKKLREQNRTWMIHIDTDEYIVINPKLRKLQRFNGSIDIPHYAEGSIIPRLLNQMVVSRWDTVNYPCVSLPRLIYGSVEDHPSIHKQTIPQFFNASRFETIRWKFHANFDDSDLNKQPKVMIDVSAIPDDDKMLTEGRVFSIHRPSQYLCRTQGQMRFSSTNYFPFSVNHYLGTFERFGARDDLRRNRKLYDQKANIRAGKDDDWIDGWIDSFIQDVGRDKVHDLLQRYLIE